MLLTITTTHSPATDLGYLLHKNPAKVQTFSQSFGPAIVFYPEATPERCTVTLLVDVDPIALVRGRSGGEGPLAQYVNDRPYAASSLLSVAIGEVFGSALAGRSKDHQELADTALPFEAFLPVVPSRGGEKLLRAMFEPLGYAIEAQRLPYDDTFSEWGGSPYFSVKLSATLRLRELLAHLYVLLPVLDNDKHYWVGEAEVEKLLRHGDTWLAAHPQKDLITSRYLKHLKGLSRQALERLERLDAAEDEDEAEETYQGKDASEKQDHAGNEAGHADNAPTLGATTQAQVKAEAEAALERPLSLNQRRIASVLEEVLDVQPNSVIDVGCGDGKVLVELARQKTLTQIVGMDVSMRALAIAESRLERLATMQRERVTLLHGSLTYRDRRLEGFDVATCIEVIEHLDPERVYALERTLFRHARPRRIVLTTPNREYNARFTGMAEGALRHADHRFEWTREEFQAWAMATAQQHGYAARFRGVGDEDSALGAPTQMAVFDRIDSNGATVA